MTKSNLPPLRRAVVNSDDPAIKNYLPAGYWVVKVEGGKTYIEGADRGGWTLDGYVIPRLGSGMLYCEEILEDDDAEHDRFVEDCYNADCDNSLM